MPPTIPASQRCICTWRGACSTCSTTCGDAGRFDEANGCLDRLTRLAASHRHVPAIRLELAKGAFNLMNDFIRAGRLEEARSYLARIGRLANDHPDDIEVRLRVGRAAVNLIKTFATAGRRDEAMGIAVACRPILASPEFRRLVRQDSGPEGAAQFEALLAGLARATTTPGSPSRT